MRRSLRQSAGHLRHVARTRFERLRPRLAGDDSAYSPGGVPDTGEQVRPPARAPRAGSLSPAQVRRLRRSSAVVVDTADERMTLALAGSGCLVARPDESGDEPTALSILRTSELLAADHGRRLRYAARLRTDAWSRRAPRRSLTVLLASSRPSQVPHVVGQLAQQGTPFQLVVGLHGEGWSRDDEARFRTIADEVHVVRAPSTTNLGDLLNMLTDAADGELVSKWDDDDYYGASHLWDLLATHRYADAEIVGKGASFIYLEGSDVTIRRPLPAEVYDTNIAGGTIMLSKDDLLEVGGWPSVGRHVDQLLVERIVRRGGWAYRTHSLGYVLARHSAPQHGHTWNATDDYFLRSAQEVRPGLDLEFADVVS